MSSKLLGCLQYRFEMVVPQINFKTIWKDASLRIHTVFYGNEYLSDSEQKAIKVNVWEIFIHNRKNNPNYWCACFPNEFNNGANSSSFPWYVDYAIVSLANPNNFQENGVDLLPDWQLFWEKSYLEKLEIVSDSADESE